MEKKNKNKAIIGTIITHALLLLLLFVFAFRTPLPLPEEKGILVDFGGGGGGGGQSGEMSDVRPENVSENNQNVSDPSRQTEQYVTQNTERTNVVSSDSKSQVKEQPVVDPRISNFWSSNSSKSSQGSGTGTGTGNGSGNGSGTGSGTGTGDGSGVGPGSGDGSGPNFNLHGRSSKYIPIPEYTEQDQGKVVVDIWVDKNGNVTKAIAGAKGTTTSNPSLWKKAQQAALNAKFSVNANAPEEQKGTITYNFIRMGG